MCGRYSFWLWSVLARVRHFLRFNSGGTRPFPHPFFVYWCVCAFVCAYICVCVLEKQWASTRIRPRKSFFIRACRGGSYANNLKILLYLLLFFFTSKSNISSAFHMFVYFLSVVFVRSPFGCFCVGVCLPLIYLSFYSQNSS